MVLPGIGKHHFRICLVPIIMFTRIVHHFTTTYYSSLPFTHQEQKNLYHTSSSKPLDQHSFRYSPTGILCNGTWKSATMRGFISYHRKETYEMNRWRNTGILTILHTEICNGLGVCPDRLGIVRISPGVLYSGYFFLILYLWNSSQAKTRRATDSTVTSRLYLSPIATQEKNKFSFFLFVTFFCSHCYWFHCCILHERNVLQKTEDYFGVLTYPRQATPLNHRWQKGQDDIRRWQYFTFVSVPLISRGSTRLQYFLPFSPKDLSTALRWFPD